MTKNTFVIWRGGEPGDRIVTRDVLLTPMPVMSVSGAPVNVVENPWCAPLVMLALVLWFLDQLFRRVRVFETSIA